MIWRLKGRQLHMFPQNEPLSVKIALSTAIHHRAQRPRPVVDVSREREVREENDAPHSQKPPLLWDATSWFETRAPFLTVASLAAREEENEKEKDKLQVEVHASLRASAVQFVGGHIVPWVLRRLE